MPSTLNLNKSAIYSANNVSQFDAGDVLAREAQSVYEKGLDTFKPREGWTEEQTAYAARRAEEWQALVERAYNDILHRRASWVLVTVAGPSNYPAARMQKRAESEMKASSEWSEKMTNFLENTKKVLAALIPVAVQIKRYRTGHCSEPISSDDPVALEKLTARLEYLKEYQESMKAMNAYYRKNKTMQGYPGISEETAAKLNHASENAYSYQKKQPFQSFELQNNGANITRIEERIAHMQKLQDKFAAPDASAPIEYDGFRVEQNAADNRIRFFFESKPDDQTRQMLKSWGFKWSPNAGAWQRQLNDNGLYAARQVIEKLCPTGKKPAGVAEDEPQEITLSQFAACIAQA